jgi:hypothetical protein
VTFILVPKMNTQMLDIYTDYLISQNHYATATGLATLLENEISHDQVTRFLHSGDFGSKELWLQTKANVKASEKATGGVLIVDDTIEEKNYTDENDIVCWHYSHAKGRHVKGMNIVTCMARYDDIAFPISYEVVKKDIPFCDLETKKQKRRTSVTKNEMFQGMLRQACLNKVLFEHVLADNWFGSRNNMRFIHDDLGKKFIIGIKSNRTVTLSRVKGKKSHYQQVKSLDLKDGETCRVWLKNLAIPVQLLKKVFTNENGTIGTLYLVTNDLSIAGDHMYEIYQKRWRIGVSREGHINPVGESPTGVTGSSPVAWEASYRKWDEALRQVSLKEVRQNSRL